MNSTLSNNWGSNTLGFFVSDEQKTKSINDPMEVRLLKEAPSLDGDIEKSKTLSNQPTNKKSVNTNNNKIKRSLYRCDERLSEEQRVKRSQGSLATVNTIDKKLDNWGLIASDFFASDEQKIRSEKALLTNYKKDVDISKKYGLNDGDLLSAKLKIKKQEDFLKYSYIKNKMTQQTFSLKDCIVSSNHNPHRYYGEIQNRINTLEQEATKANLTPIFLTLTLPSAFHRMKVKNKKLVKNSKYNGVQPKEAVKVLTKMWGKLRQDRSLKELTKMQRMYYRVNEPHQDGTPHTHILLFVPSERIERIEKAFKRLFNPKANKLEKEIRSATSYIMKYINKTLPMSKEKISKQDEYLNTWYIKHRINRFCSSRSTAPMYLYRMLNHRFTLYGLTQVQKRNGIQILSSMENGKIMEIWDNEELLYMRAENIEINLMNNFNKAS